MDYKISKQYEGCAVKDYIQKELRLSSKMLTRLKHLESGIMLNGNSVTVRARLTADDILSLSVDHEFKLSDEIVPVRLPLDIIYEDEYYIALNKPPYMPTHPSHNHRDDTLANGLSYLYSTQNKPFVFRAVNRLDRDTSGIVIFAKTADAAHRFSKMQQSKTIVKNYIAIANGLCNESGIIEGYIRRKEKSVILRVFEKEKTHADGAYSLTEYKTLASGNDASLVHLTLHTGRTHQIRVHLSSIGHFVLGDDLYGEKTDTKRQMLHAYKMIFTHPYTHHEIIIKAKIPEDMISELKRKGINYEF